MKKIISYNDLLAIEQLLPIKVAKYFGEEFQGMYEYLSNSEEVEEFQLPPHQAMIILESEGEVSKLLGNPNDIEFVEEIQIGSVTLQRIGVYQSEDVQLYYYFKTKVRV